MPYAVQKTSAIAATAFAKRCQPNPPPDIIEGGATWIWSAPEKPECESRPRCHETQTELAHANRFAISAQLSASIAHEINQPIGAIVTNAETALRLLRARPRNMEAVQRLLGRIVKDGMRAGDIVHRTRALMKNAPPRSECLEINAVIREAVDLTHDKLGINGITLKMKLAKKLPLIQGDRVQLQQVMVNLIVNAVEAMGPHAAKARNLVVCTAKTKSCGVLVELQDSGPGVDSENLERIFDAFFSTKVEGMGMGLSICRTIVEAHGGRLWTTPNEPRGAVFCMMLPITANRMRA
jgi:C4-dicarboxylate-specific signal transduction histidine kinase